ncbi:N-acyl amino acid synthase FeeM domain-containing protein [Acidimangrovimonas sediminis]|uniref:N-acyl amino acid synthase FeeM domain-containing protein n=1 Tax=Acidimangrovimonas sediminis TaxID=2056283 RepID=UPI000C801847|nr:GNAT family N-acetyltransferase [Acidimangrovimonas sediminis]
MQDKVLETLKQCDYQVFTKGDDPEPIYRLRYDCYRAENSIPENASRMMSDPYDESPNCVHVAVRFRDTYLAAVRLHIATDQMWNAPTIDVFPEYLNAVPFGKSILDPTRFVVRREARAAGLPMHFVALRIPFLASMFYDIDLALAPVRVEHSAFYLRYLGYDVCEMPRLYPGLRKPVGLLATKVKEQQGAVLARYPFLGPVGSIPRSDIAFPDLHEVFPAAAPAIPRVA